MQVNKVHHRAVNGAVDALPSAPPMMRARLNTVSRSWLRHIQRQSQMAATKEITTRNQRPRSVPCWNSP